MGAHHMRLAGFISESVVDGPGLRCVVFAQGCVFACEGCHNPSNQDLSGGEVVPVVDVIRQIGSAKMATGVTFSGGEPFLQAAAFVEIGRAVTAMGKDIVTFTGYTWEELIETAASSLDVRELVEMSMLIVDGRFVLAERDLSLPFRGSRNQRIIDVAKSLSAGYAIDWAPQAVP